MFDFPGATAKMAVMLASIPSPSRGVIEIGPLELHAYGLMLALGVLAAATIAERRWTRAGGEPRTIAEIGVPVIVAGVLGARIYHLFTGYDWSDGGITGALKIWEGGLSIWGAVAGGAIAVVVIARRKHLSALALMDAMAPGIAVAQAIGRWGNWFNQELFGRPTDLPWGLEIDPDQRPPEHFDAETFHPTFLYESLWCLAVAVTIVWAERRLRLRAGQPLALYIAMYTFGRIWFEALRADPASELLGVRFNLLLSIVLSVGGTIWFVVLGRHARVKVSEVRVDERSERD
ncbi:MAG: prolipoprotein diacylglyceryl transferase [Actinomycetota bacterium]